MTRGGGRFSSAIAHLYDRKPRQVPQFAPWETVLPRKLGRKRHARQTRDRQTRLPGGAWCRSSLVASPGTRRKLRAFALRQWRAAAREIPAEKADDRPDQPAAAIGNAILHLQRRRDHAEQRVLRPLSPGRYPLPARSRSIHPQGQGQGRASAAIVAEGNQETAG